MRRSREGHGLAPRGLLELYKLGLDSSLEMEWTALSIPLCHEFHLGFSALLSHASFCSQILTASLFTLQTWPSCLSWNHISLCLRPAEWQARPDFTSWFGHWLTGALGKFLALQIHILLQGQVHLAVLKFIIGTDAQYQSYSGLCKDWELFLVLLNSDYYNNSSNRSISNNNNTVSWAELEPHTGETGMNERCLCLLDPHWATKKPRTGAGQPQPWARSPASLTIRKDGCEYTLR